MSRSFTATANRGVGKNAAGPENCVIVLVRLEELQTTLS
jgi:hypothetical protein